jgi:3-oxoadipate enol-lactonase
MKTFHSNSICKTEYGDIYYEISGIYNTTTIIFIHDVGMNHHVFENQITALSNHYKIVVWDLPGHGRSSIIKTNERFSSLAADCLNSLMENAGIEKAFLVGQAMGNIIAQRFQLKHSGKVHATIHVPENELKSSFDSWSKILTPVLNGVFNILPSKSFYRSLFKQHKLVNQY